MIKERVIPIRRKGAGWFGDPEGHRRAALMRKSYGGNKSPKKPQRGGQREAIYRLQSLILALEFIHPDIRLPELKAAKEFLTKHKGD